MMKATESKAESRKQKLADHGLTAAKSFNHEIRELTRINDCGGLTAKYAEYAE